MQDSLALTGREFKPSGFRESLIGNLVGLIRHIDDKGHLTEDNSRSMLLSTTSDQIRCSSHNFNPCPQKSAATKEIRMLS